MPASSRMHCSCAQYQGASALAPSAAHPLAVFKHAGLAPGRCLLIDHERALRSSDPQFAIAAKLPLERVRRRCFWALDRTLTVLNRMLMSTGIRS